MGKRKVTPTAFTNIADDDDDDGDSGGGSGGGEAESSSKDGDDPSPNRTSGFVSEEGNYQLTQ